MPAIGDVVELSNGDVGVIGEELPRDQWRVYFPGGYLDVLAAAISQTLSAPTYEVGDTVSVWPYQGDVKSVDGDDVTVTLDRSVRIPGVGVPQWEPDVTVPFWRIVRDNDERLQRAL